MEYWRLGAVVLEDLPLASSHFSLATLNTVATLTHFKVSQVAWDELTAVEPKLRYVLRIDSLNENMK